MKKVIILLIFLAILPASFAEITIKTSQDVYNIGNGIGAYVSVIEGNAFQGLFKMTMDCGAYKLDYFLTPLSLEPDFVTAVNVPDVKASKSMIGNCVLMGSLISEGQVAEESSSNNFEVTDNLSILPVQSKITALPADSVQITGIINEAFGNNVLKATVDIALGNLSLTTDSFDGKFNATIRIPKNVRSGQHSIDITAADSKGNSGTGSVELYITPVPIYLKIDSSETSIAPGLKVNITSTIFDQADDVINDSLSLELTSPSGNKVFTKAVQSNEKIGYEFSQYSEPGIYNLAAGYRNLVASYSINITTIKGVKIRYQNESVIVENIGNVVFDDELTFVLESTSDNYTVTRKISIEPAKTLILDLSKEVPSGFYDVLVPLKEGFDLIKDNIEQQTSLNITSLFSGKDILAYNVMIHDNRPIHKKVVSGFNSMSGFLVGADGVLTRNPIIGPMILLSILVLIFIRYGGKPLLRMIRRKKQQEDKEEKMN